MSDEDKLKRIQERGYQIFLETASFDDRQALISFLKSVDEKARAAATDNVTIEAIAQKIVSVTGKIEGRKSALDILQSPPFYFAVGLLLLAFSFVANSLELNSSLNFLVAMLGVAILLYSTGSQAAGTIGATPPALGDTNVTSGSEEGKSQTVPKAVGVPPGVNVAIAGGAAVLTAFFGWGVIYHADKIRQVFRDFDQYQIVRVDFCKGSADGCDGQPGSDLNIIELQKNIYLQTELGITVYSRPTKSGLEYIVFKRDLGELHRLRFDGNISNPTGLKLVVSPEFFELQNEDDCLVSPPSRKGCLLRRTAADSRDLNRVTNVALTVVVSPEGNPTALTDNNVEIRSSIPVTPL